MTEQSIALARLKNRWDSQLGDISSMRLSLENRGKRGPRSLQVCRSCAVLALPNY